MLLNNNREASIKAGLKQIKNAVSRVESTMKQGSRYFANGEKKRLTALFVCIFLVCSVQAEEHKPPDIEPYKIPTFTGAPVDWHKIKPAINPIKAVDGDAIFNIINKCYPLKSGFGLEVNLRAGVNTRLDNGNNSNTIQTYDSQAYYAGIVANMPLYSDIEIDKERKLEYQRREQTATTIKDMLSAVAAKRRAERMMGLYLSLEKRSQARVENGIASVDEQIGYLEKVAQTQAELDKSKAEIEGARIALIGQCRPDVVEQVNGYILSEIGDENEHR